MDLKSYNVIKGEVLFLSLLLISILSGTSLYISLGNQWHTIAKDLEKQSNTSFKTRQNITEFQNLVLKHSINNIILVSTTDYFYLSLAFNLYYTIKQLNIKNFIFVCIHEHACNELKARNIQ